MDSGPIEEVHPVKALRILNFLFVALCVLLTVAALASGIPYLGVFGTAILPSFAPWFATVPLALEALLLWRASPSDVRSQCSLSLATVFVSAACLFVLADVKHCANKAGIGLDVLPLFSLHTATSGLQPRESITYNTDEHGPLRMAVYRPKLRGSGKPAAIIVNIHGGGWISGKYSDHDRDMQWYADQGWLVLSAQYTLSDSGSHLWDRTPQQIGCVLAWVYKNGAMLGGDPERVSMIGDSAGGNLALNSAFQADHGTLTSSCGGTIPKVAAVVTTYPVVDAVAFYESRDALLSGFAKQMTSQYTGGTPARYPERYASISSRTYLTAAAPPFLVLEGAADHLVPPAATYALINEAKALGVQADMIRVPFGEHGFDAMFGSAGNQLVRKATVAFLIAHGQQP